MRYSFVSSQLFQLYTLNKHCLQYLSSPSYCTRWACLRGYIDIRVILKSKRRLDGIYKDLVIKFIRPSETFLFRNLGFVDCTSVQCGAGGGWKRSVGLIVWEMKMYCLESRSRGISYMKYVNGRRTRLVTFCVETAFYNGLLKERYKGG